MQHQYFGKLDLDNKCVWEKESELNGYPVELTLWVLTQENLTLENLDKMATHCQNIVDFHQKSQQALIDYLTNDDKFINYYVDAIEDYDLPQLAQLIDTQLTAENFVKLLKLQTFSMWIDDALGVQLDYMLDPEQSDQILCVKFDMNGECLHIAWES